MSATRPTLLLVLLHAGCTATGASPGMSIRESSFGTTADGTAVKLFELHNPQGLIAKVTDYGATLVEMHVPDRDGRLADVVLGFDDVSGYQSEANQYFGCTVGRVANRIAEGRFRLDGQQYRLATNNGPHHLHGGVRRSLDKVVWNSHPIRTREGTGIEFRYTSPDGEEGYPGVLQCTVRYLLTDANDLRIEYAATTDRRTPVNLTNHAYWNLAGAGADTVDDHVIQIGASGYTPTDDTLIPTGVVLPVAGTPLDLRVPTRIGDRLPALTPTAAAGFDHNFVLDRKGAGLRFAAQLKDPASGRVLDVFTSEPGIQVYSGNFLHGQRGKNGRGYVQRGAICLETQHYPDSVNHEAFPSTILEPGQTYRQVTLYRFSTAIRPPR